MPSQPCAPSQDRRSSILHATLGEMSCAVGEIQQCRQLQRRAAANDSADLPVPTITQMDRTADQVSRASWCSAHCFSVVGRPQQQLWRSVPADD